MKKLNRKTKIVVSGMLSLIILASTWAFFSSESQIENELYTKSYGADTIEKFKPKQELEPGTEIEKEVGVKNTGDYDLVVRIRFEEEWARNNSAFITFNSIKDDNTFNNAIISAVKSPEGKVTSTQTNATDGLTANDESVMYKNLPGVVSGKWTKGNDGWFYYAVPLKAGMTTELLLDSLILAGDTDMGKYNVTEKYSVATVAIIEGLEATYETAKAEYLADQDNGTKKAAMDAAAAALEAGYAWQTTKPADDQITFKKAETKIDAMAGGYASADYTLTIVTQVCQATLEAVTATWENMDSNVKTAWALQ